MLKIFITLLAISGFTAANESCAGRVSFVCNPSEPQPGFPKTAEDLKEVCNILIKAFECAIDYEQRCDSQPGTLAKSINVLSILNEICSDDTLLHEVVVENLGCFEEILLAPNECKTEPPYDEDLEELAGQLLKEGLDARNEDEDEEDQYSCLSSVNQFACLSVLTEKKCGTVAMDAFNEMLRKIGVPYLSDCDERFTEMLPTLIRLQRLANEVEEASKKRKK